MSGSDRRVERSKNALRSALIELMIEQAYESISVAAIAERANVGRATFYAHFADKDDLFQDGFARLRDMLLTAAAQDAKDPFAFVLPMLHHAYENRTLFAALVDRRGGALVTDMMHTTLSDVLRQRMPLPKDAELVVEFAVGGFIAVLSWWLQKGSQYAPEQVETIFRRLIRQGVSAQKNSERFARIHT